MISKIYYEHEDRVIIEGIENDSDIELNTATVHYYADKRSNIIRIITSGPAEEIRS